MSRASYATLAAPLQSIQPKGAHINIFSPLGTTRRPF